jgi:hypothetical protein
VLHPLGQLQTLLLLPLQQHWQQQWLQPLLMLCQWQRQQQQHWQQQWPQSLLMLCQLIMHKLLLCCCLCVRCLAGSDSPVV